MEKNTTRHTTLKSTALTGLFAAALTLLFAAPSLALGFTVHGYELGERIQLKSGRNVWTAEFNVSLEGGAVDTNSYCVDLDTYIGAGTYEVRDVLDAFDAPVPVGEAARDFSWAGHVMNRYGARIDSLVGEGVTRRQAITGVQAAIWEGIYEGEIVDATSLSTGARGVFDQILANPFVTGGGVVIVDLAGNQDQVVSAPVPEPSAALVFGLGALLAGRATRKS
ncbi:MAG: hypothetical protein AB8G23_23255 [Myxococcota bacterium]